MAAPVKCSNQFWQFSFPIQVTYNTVGSSVISFLYLIYPVMSNFNLKTENIRVSEDPMRTHRNSCSGRFKVRTHSINTHLAAAGLQRNPTLRIVITNIIVWCLALTFSFR